MCMYLKGFQGQRSKVMWIPIYETLYTCMLPIQTMGVRIQFIYIAPNKNNNTEKPTTFRWTLYEPILGNNRKKNSPLTGKPPPELGSGKGSLLPPLGGGENQ